MSKDKLTDYDATAGNNTDIGGISVDEGMLPSNVNNALRELMSHLKDFAAGTEAVTNVKSDTVTADTLAEKTTDNGVTVDGLLIKDKEIGTSAAPATLQASAINSGQIGGRHNVVINGAMNVCQRGTSTSGLGDVSNSGYHVQDRFDMVFSTSGRFTMSQDSDAPEGFGSAMKLACTTADTSIAAGEFGLISYQIEGQDLQHLHKGTSSAKELTLSFYAKANASKTYVVEMRDYDNSRIMCKTFTVGTSYSRIELTFPADTTGELDNDNARSFAFNIWVHAGSDYTSGTLGAAWAASVTANRAAGCDSFFSSTSNTFFITGVQLEVGSVATEFEHRSFGDELALCQRYFMKFSASRTIYGADYGSNSFARAYFPVTMRASPTVTATVNKTVIDNYHSTDVLQIYMTGNAGAMLPGAEADAEL